MWCVIWKASRAIRIPTTPSGVRRRCWQNSRPTARRSIEHAPRAAQSATQERTMTDAVIVSTARTGLAKSWRGGFNLTHGATLAAHVIKHALERAKVEGGEVDDVMLGCALPE